MGETNDHDLLISVSKDIASMKECMENWTNDYKDHETRIRKLEGESSEITAVKKALDKINDVWANRIWSVVIAVVIFFVLKWLGG